jgi:GntR family transcriptional regulator
MDISILMSSPEPVYEQIVRQVQGGVAQGLLKPGDPLPTVRQLATDLELNRNTVARAYKLLEDQGVILTAGRKGTFVRDDASHEVGRLKSDQAVRQVREMVSALRGAGLQTAEISALFNEALLKVKP